MPPIDVPDGMHASVFFLAGAPTMRRTEIGQPEGFVERTVVATTRAFNALLGRPCPKPQYLYTHLYKVQMQHFYPSEVDRALNGYWDEPRYQILRWVAVRSAATSERLRERICGIMEVPFQARPTGALLNRLDALIEAEVGEDAHDSLEG